MKKRLGTLEEDLCLLRRRIAELESTQKIGKLEAAEVYDKTLRLMQRMAKRYEVDKKEAEPLTGADLPVPHSDGDGLDPISRKIHARRGGVGK